MGPSTPSSPRALVRYRRAGPHDIGTLVDHRHRMLLETGLGSVRELFAHDREYRRWVRPRLASGEYMAVLAERAGVPLGSGGLWWRKDIPRPGYGRRASPYLASMYTEPEARGQGIASRIVRELLDLARAGRANRVNLHASVMGLPIYERLGFERTREMRFYVDRAYARRLQARRARLSGRAAGAPRRSAPEGSEKGPRRSRSPRRGRSGPAHRN
jgi:GNAT superfamily N-acetyltransferase